MKKTTLLLILSAFFAVSCGSQTNIALHKTVTASSTFDNNLTAQLLSDGISDCTEPAFVEVFTPDGEVDKVERENSLDSDFMSRNILNGTEGWIEYRFHGYAVAADQAEVLYQEALQGGKGGPKETVTVPVTTNPETGALKIELSFPHSGRWRIKDVKFLSEGKEVTDILPSEHFTSAWLSDGCTDEWIQVDLGSSKKVSGIKMHWITRPESGWVEVSNDGERWARKADIGSADALSFQAVCRYVRLHMCGGAERFCMSELEVIGREKKAAPAADAWMLQRASQVAEDGAALSQTGFKCEGWIPATVPGTVLSSFIDIGAVPDPDYGDNWSQISDSYFDSDFWYRKEFTQKKVEGKRYFLCFDGINWKAEVYLNGKQVSYIEGAFIRNRTDVTDLLKDGSNALAVKIIRNAHPGAVKTKTGKWTGYNGGVLGADSPTFLASVGWDWMTSVRGRNIGIWRDVRIEEKGIAQISDPLITTTVSEDGKASIKVSATLITDGPTEVEGWIGDIKFSQEVVESGEVVFGPDYYTQLKDTELELWWPSGYGPATLHDAGFKVKVNGEISDSLSFKAGLREITWNEDGGALKLFVNGRRINPRGGNWGFCQQNLRFSDDDYLTAVDYHGQMNFNMIRNWVGQVAHEGFYDACDQCGILIWQDFWLANPGDGPDPDNEEMFLANAYDYIQRIRRHPSVALYCGRNEGYPPETLDKELKHYVEMIHPGIPYISSSADGPVSGRGPYNARPIEEYFAPLEKFHSERGMPNIPPYESLVKMMDANDLWPQSDMWGKHDFTTDGAQKAVTYNNMVTNAFGETSSAEEFAGLAQWINYDGYRAIFEGANSSGRQGMLLWMSHSCWPSLVFSTYDYYFRKGGAFFGCQEACEPLHIQYNPISGKAELINNGVGDVNEIWASATVYDWHGETLSDYMAIVNIPNDSTVPSIDIEKPDTQEPYFISLKLSDQNGNEYSNNFYMIPGANGLKELRTLPEAELETFTQTDEGYLGICIKNTDKVPALMLRLIITDDNGEEILPNFYSDNYFSLMPGEYKIIDIGWPAKIKVKNPKVIIKQLASYNEK